MEYTKYNLTNSDPNWNKWTDCKGSCGETGYTSRYRSTTSSDVLCEFNHEWKTCHILGCTISNYTKSAEGNELRTRELNYILQRARNANRMIIDAFFSGNCNYYALKNVFTNNIDRLWNALLCVKHNLGCPVKGGWSKWSSWSKCTATCGSGMQYRLRYCDHPSPSRTSLNCSGNHIEFKNCLGKSCTAKTNGTWCKWMKWSGCSVRQGNGIVVRKRFCRSSNNNNDSFHVMSCSGPHTEIGRCYSSAVDGGWSEWQKWSPCSATCDAGTRYRIRSCSRPEPEGSGRQCEGETVQTNICYVRPCKGVKTIINNY
ncbi:thrombospondin-1-like [Metopolophium dirhodum]|uniref:thrombospondin-1-like n=1 Tax=Metopolophium dirhodum TaxID=44670 RepID=UPI0029907F98|nr:thrombospondin-1-like [Metopolophium dirhodum]